MYKSVPFYISGVHTGYRVIDENGRVIKQFVGDIYKSKSFNQAQERSEEFAATLNTEELS